MDDDAWARMRERIERSARDAFRESKEEARAQHEDWRETVTTQHGVLATLAGLQVTALTLFSAVNKSVPSKWEKLFFALSLLLFVIIVSCLVYIAEHERRNAFKRSKDTDAQRHWENIARRILNVATCLNALAIASLLLLSYVFVQDTKPSIAVSPLRHYSSSNHVTRHASALRP